MPGPVASPIFVTVPDVLPIVPEEVPGAAEPEGTVVKLPVEPVPGTPELELGVTTVTVPEEVPVVTVVAWPGTEPTAGVVFTVVTFEPELPPVGEL